MWHTTAMTSQGTGHVVQLESSHMHTVPKAWEFWREERKGGYSKIIISKIKEIIKNILSKLNGYFTYQHFSQPPILIRGNEPRPLS